MFKLQFPREIGLPNRKLVRTKEEYYKFINLNRNHYNLFTNVYNFKDFEEYKPIYSSIIFDRVFIDCDPKIIHTEDNIEYRADNGYLDFITIIDWLLENKYIFYPYCSGSGYHIYITCKIIESIKDIKSIIYNTQVGIIEQVNKNLGENHFIVIDKNYKIISKWHSEKEAEMIAKSMGDNFLAIDGKIKGDYRTYGRPDSIARIPFSYNQKAQKFCIPITENLLHLGDAEIKKKAADKEFVIRLMNYPFTGYGTEIMDCSKYNNITKFDNGETIILNFKEGEIKENSKIPEITPDCIRKLMNQNSLGWDFRRVEIVWLRDIGFNINEAAEILKSHLTKTRKHGNRIMTDFEHCISAEDGKQLQNLYSKRDLLFPKYETLFRSGLCPFTDNNLCNKKKYGCMLYGNRMR
jgi:hypothetical protein